MQGVTDATQVIYHIIGQFDYTKPVVVLMRLLSAANG